MTPLELPVFGFPVKKGCNKVETISALRFTTAPDAADLKELKLIKKLINSTYLKGQQSLAFYKISSEDF